MWKFITAVVFAAVWSVPASAIELSPAVGSERVALSAAAPALVREGDFALLLLEALDMAPAESEEEAEARLADAGIAPVNGWIADYPVTPDIIGELHAAVIEAAAAGRIKQGPEQAAERLLTLASDFDIPLPTALDPAHVASLAPASEASRVCEPSDLYDATAPSVVSYCEPAPKYRHLYTRVPYDYGWYGYRYPGYFILHDFHLLLHVGHRHDHFRHRHFKDGHHKRKHHGGVKHLSNHHRDRKTGKVYRVDPLHRDVRDGHDGVTHLSIHHRDRNTGKAQRIDPSHRDFHHRTERKTLKPSRRDSAAALTKEERSALRVIPRTERRDSSLLRGGRGGSGSVIQNGHIGKRFVAPSRNEPVSKRAMTRSDRGVANAKPSRDLPQKTFRAGGNRRSLDAPSMGRRAQGSVPRGVASRLSGDRSRR